MVDPSRLGGSFGNVFTKTQHKIALPCQYCGHMGLPLFNHGLCWGLIRCFCSQPSWQRKHNFGIAFDIDGVLLRGSTPIDGASRALRQLYWDAVKPSMMKIPFVFLTNGGGVSESTKASELSKQFGVKIIPQQVLLGHTPFKTLVNCFQNARILAVGKGEPATVMTEYGFRNAVSMDDYVWQFEGIDPLAKYKHWAKPPAAVNGHAISPSFMNPKQIDAVFIVSDPVDWGRDIQVLCDVMRSGGLPGRHSGRQPPLFFAADDFEYQAAFPVQRFGMGAFRIALENIYNRLGGPALKFTSFGKPKAIVYKNAELALQEIATMLELKFNHAEDGGGSTVHVKDCSIRKNLDTIYMIGDNPATDVFGAREAGKPWFSILTKTGCFKDQVNHSEYPADLVTDDVEEAIHFILNKHIPE